MSPTSLRSLCLVLLAMLCCMGAPVQAQDMGKKKKPQVILQRDRTALRFDTVKCVKNVIKLNPLQFFRGEIPIHYERALTPRLSLELGLGFTWRNFLNLSLTGDDADDYGQGTELLARPTYHLGVRYYLVDDIEPQGTYVQLELAHLNYSKDIRLKEDSTGRLTDDRLRDERIYNDIKFLFGYQRLSATSNWLFDVYGGIGMRSRSMMIVREDIQRDAANENAIYFDYEVVEKNDLVPSVYLGVKVGVGF